MQEGRQLSWNNSKEDIGPIDSSIFSKPILKANQNLINMTIPINK